jgi:hypothetical protein
MNAAGLGLVLLLFGPEVSLSQSPSANIPAVAYESEGAIFIATSSGRILQSLKTIPAVGTFSVFNDARKIVFAPLGTKPDSYGGQLYLLVPPKTTATRLTHGPYYDKSARSSEVYSNPDFSPDGKRVVFSVHSQSAGDAVEASGPFATIDLKSSDVNLLASTLHVPGEAWGTAYAASAYWSPNGSEILLNFEDGFALTDPEGKLFENLSAMTTGDEWTSSIGWLGSQCVVYVGGKDYPDSQKRPARFLNLRTHQSGALEELLDLRKNQVTGLVSISGEIRVRRQERELLVESGSDHWSIPDTDGRTQIRILPRATSEVPESCR